MNAAATKLPTEMGPIHFVGIGGIGMSGIAELLLNLGYHVSGSDLKRTAVTRNLARLGGMIFEGHREEHTEQADVVVYDRLVSKDILELVRRDAELIYAGKELANHAMPQESINQLLVKLAKEGKRVLRLKGGDPFIFDRGGEEIETPHGKHFETERVFERHRLHGSMDIASLEALPEDLLAAIRLCKERKPDVVTRVVTNAYWAQTPAAARQRERRATVRRVGSG